MAATYVKPGELGLNPEKLTEMLTELEQTVEIHSISVRFDGKVILEGAWEPFSLEKPQMLHSLSKIGTSICLGFALDEGKIHLEDKLLDYVRDELPEEYDPNLARFLSPQQKQKLDALVKQLISPQLDDKSSRR